MKDTLDPAEVFKKMCHYCAYRERSHREVQSKLLAYKLSSDQNEKILMQLQKKEYYNEERFARAFARGKFRIKKWGRIKIMQQLNQHKISQAFTEQGLQEIEDDDYYNTLIGIMKKKSMMLIKLDAAEKCHKLVQCAIQKGYEPELARRAVDELSSRKAPLK